MDNRVRTCMSIEHVLRVVYKLSAMHLISTQFCCKHSGMKYLSYSGQRWHRYSQPLLAHCMQVLEVSPQRTPKLHCT